MATYQTELFGHCVYSPDLTYDELHEREDALKNALHSLLAESGGDFIHFEPIGDTLRFQCVFEDTGESFFHLLCENAANGFADGISGRMLFVDKDLNTLHFYSLHEKRWQEAVQALPAAGTLDQSAEAVCLGELPEREQ